MDEACAFFLCFLLNGEISINYDKIMDAKRLGERLRRIRKQLGITQLQLAEATKLTQPAISRLENGEEVYASGILAVLDFFRDKVSLDHLLDPDLGEEDLDLLFCSRHEKVQRIDKELANITQDLDDTKRKIAALKSQL